VSTISVVMPAHNAGRWIDEALASVLAQGSCLREVIVIDDASTDDTAERVRRHAAADPRVLLLCNERQSGAASARNRGIAAAGGEWIAFVDADDALLPERLQIMLAAAQRTGAAIVADNLAYFRDGSDVTVRTLMPVRGMPAGGMAMSAAEFLRRSPPQRSDGLGLLQPMIRRDFLLQSQLRFRESIRSSEDFFFLLEALLAGARLHVLPGALYRYRLHAGSSMARIRDDARFDAQLQVLQELEAASTARGDAHVAAGLRAWREYLVNVQRPLLQLRTRFIRGERGAVVAQLLCRPRLWPAVAQRALAWFRRRVLGASER